MMFLTRIDPARKLQRFWLVAVTPTLLGGWSLLREWGRIGSPGTVSSRTFELEEEARRAERASIRRRERHGYQPTQNVAARWSELMAAGKTIQATDSRPKIKSRSRRRSELPGQANFDF
jgi:predicted DNA-binding WGR domain protein